MALCYGLTPSPKAAQALRAAATTSPASASPAFQHVAQAQERSPLLRRQCLLRAIKLEAHGIGAIAAQARSEARLRLLLRESHQLLERCHKPVNHSATTRKEANELPSS